MKKDYAMGCFVRLRRNYADLPFCTPAQQDASRQANARVLSVLEQEQPTYLYFKPQQMEAEQRRVLIAHRLLDADYTDNPASDAYLRQDQQLCVQAGDCDHLRIAAYHDEGSDLAACLASCQALCQALEREHPFALSPQYGHLTARPCDTGTGLRAGILLHLPMLTLLKQIASMVKLCGMAGLLLRSASSDVQLAKGDTLYWLENRLTLGTSEEDILRRLQSHAERLIGLERELREKAAARSDEDALDVIFRAYGLAQYARKISRSEGMHLWSALTLGQSMKLLNMPESKLEKLYLLCSGPQNALEAAAKQQGIKTDVLRARRIRDIVLGGN